MAEEKIIKKIDSIKKSCFIITPIGSSHSSTRRHIDGIIDAVLEPVLRAEYNIEVSHRLYDSITITKQIYKKIYESDLCIANLTGLNPNVMYELAIRFCIGKPVIIIAEEGTDLPFDVKDQRAFMYINDAQGILDLKKSLIESLKTIKFDEKINSPIHEAIGEIEIFNSIKNNNNNDNKIAPRVTELILDKLDMINEKLQLSNKAADDYSRFIDRKIFVLERRIHSEIHSNDDRNIQESAKQLAELKEELSLKPTYFAFKYRQLKKIENLEEEIRLYLREK